MAEVVVVREGAGAVEHHSATKATTGASALTSTFVDGLPRPQQTIAKPTAVSGIGFVTGAWVTARFLPAPPESGIAFTRVDLSSRPTIPAKVEYVVERQRRTALSLDGATVELTEHILAALAGLYIDNCIVELDGPEAPGMDGSAEPFVTALLEAGLVAQKFPRRVYVVSAPLHVCIHGSFVAILPPAAPELSDVLEITFNLDYGAHTPIGKQCLYDRMTPDIFSSQFAPARTFVLHHEIEALRRQGLGSRTSARDLLVFGADGKLLDNTLRFPNECVRHKMLDVVGDLALFGQPLAGHVVAHKSGHPLNAALVRELRHQQLCQLAQERRNGH